MTTKIHLAVDGQGRPVRVILTPGQSGDAPQAPALLDGFQPNHVIADKAYDSNALRELIASQGAEAVIPCNPTRKRLIPYNFTLYKLRNRIERCINKLKLPTHRNTIRPASRLLPSLHPHRLLNPMDAMNVDSA